MKILQVINAYYPPYSSGGAAFVAHNISKALARKGHQVTVYTTNVLSRDKLFTFRRNSYLKNGVKVYYFGNTIYKPSIHIYFSKELLDAIRKNIVEYDVIHLHEYRSYIGIITAYYSKKFGVPYVLQAHGQLPRIGAWRGLKWLFDIFFGYRLLRDASRVIALSRVEAEQYKHMGVPEEKIAIIPNGIDLSEYANLPPKGSFKKKFGIKEKEKIVLYLGRIHKIKGIDILIRAFANITKKMDNVKLVIVGPDDGYLSEVQTIIKALRITNNILITGPLYGRDKLEAYIDADIYVLPSRYETFPMTVLEAIACGTPVILTENCGITEFIKDKVGLVVKPDPNILYDALFRLLSNDDVDVFRENCKILVRIFDILRVVSQLEEVYSAR